MLYLLWGVLILSGLGMLLGLALFIASRVFKVKEDKRIDEVEKMLPNYNCGACGCAGCRQMAEKLVSGEEKQINKCRPGKKDKNFDPIIAYLAAHPNPEYDE